VAAIDLLFNHTAANFGVAYPAAIKALNADAAFQGLFYFSQAFAFVQDHCAMVLRVRLFDNVPTFH